MSWIKFETATSDKPEVWEISAKLGIDPDAVVGKLLRVWTWFDLHTTNGNAPSVTKSLLDAHVRVTGFCLAMIEAGWMTEDKGMIQLPNFDRHNGKTAKTRVLTAKRVANARSGNANVTLVDQKCNAGIVTDALPREEKNREEKNIKPSIVSQEKPCLRKKKKEKQVYDISTQEYPDSLNTPEFRAMWAEWVDERAMSNPLSPRAAKTHFDRLIPLGSVGAIVCIQDAIASGWKAVFVKPHHYQAKPTAGLQSPPRDPSKPLIPGSLKPGDPGYDSPEYKKLLVQHAREVEARRLADAERIPD